MDDPALAVRAVLAAVMPKGVEHPCVTYAGRDDFYVLAAVMPKGVEHATICHPVSIGFIVLAAVMPKGVEHTVFELVVERQGEGVGRSDAERR